MEPKWPIPEIDVRAFPIAKPSTDKDMQWESRRWTLCQILREIYHTTKNEEIKKKCLIAATMAKTMATTITSHDPAWGSHRWPWRKKENE